MKILTTPCVVVRDRAEGGEKSAYPNSLLSLESAGVLAGWKQTQHKQHKTAIKPHISTLQHHTVHSTKTVCWRIYEYVCHPISHPLNLSVCPPCLALSLWHFRQRCMYITEVRVHRCWIVARTLSAATACQKQS